MLSGCRTSIPATDTEPPGVDVIATGPDFRNYHCGTTECSPTPDLTSGAGPYGEETIMIPDTDLGDGNLTFAVTVGDAGGVREAGVTIFGRENLDYQIIDPPSGAIVRDPDAAHKQIFVAGDRAAPRTVLGLTVKIHLPSNSGGIAVTGFGIDYGGSSGRSNSNENRATNYQIWHRP